MVLGFLLVLPMSIIYLQLPLNLPAVSKIKLSSNSNPPRIRYQLHRNGYSVYRNRYGQYQCRDHRKRRRKATPTEIYYTKNMFDFGATVETDLNLIFLGDSVGLQFSHAFEEAAAVPDHGQQRQVLRYTTPRFEGLHLSPTLGGGWVAGWRLTGMLLRQGEGKPLPNEHGGGWTRDDAILLQWKIQMNNTQNKSFDTMIFRIPQGWIQSKEVNAKTLTETTELAHELFGVKSIIFVSLPLCNNYMESFHVTEMLQVNERLQLFARNRKPSERGVQHVLVLDFGRFAWLLVSWNARLLNFTGSLESIYTHRLGVFRRHEYFPPAQAHVCSERMDPKSGECIRNYMTFDG